MPKIINLLDKSIDKINQLSSDFSSLKKLALKKTELSPIQLMLMSILINDEGFNLTESTKFLCINFDTSYFFYEIIIYFTSSSVNVFISNGNVDGMKAIPINHIEIPIVESDMATTLKYAIIHSIEQVLIK